MQTLQSFSRKATYWLKVVSLGLILGLGLQFAQAWVAPTVAPPGGNVSGPVTTGIGNQTKTGNLGVGGLQVSRDMDSVKITSSNAGVYSGIEFYQPGDPTYTGGIRSHVNYSGQGRMLELWSGAGANIGMVRVTGAGSANSNFIVDGNVGIGTVNPNQKLSVNGNIETFGSGNGIIFPDGTKQTTAAGGGGSGTVTSIGTGAGLTGGPITGAGTINVDTNYLQRRVSASCAVGSSIRSIAADGTVTCEAAGVGAPGSVAGGCGNTGRVISCWGGASYRGSGLAGNTCPGGTTYYNMSTELGGMFVCVKN